MLNTEHEWVLMVQRRRNLVCEAWAYRLHREASRDRLSLRARILGSIGAWMIDIGTSIKAHCWHLPEKPHAFITPPQDRVYA